MNEQQSESPRRGAEGYIYVIEFDEGTTKVGYTTTPRKRLGQHGGHAEAFGISIAQSWMSQPHVEARANERALIAWCVTHAPVTRRSEYFAGLDYSSITDFAASLPMSRHTDAAFQKHEYQARRNSQMFIRLAKTGLIAAAPRVHVGSFDLSAEDPEQVLATARLCDLTVGSARAVLANDATRDVVHEFLERAFDGYEVKDLPLQPGVMSQWDYLISPHTTGKHDELIDPLFEAARTLGIELEEQFHTDDLIAEDALVDVRALPARDVAR